VAGRLGPALDTPAAGYTAVYHLELALLFVALVVIGPIVGRTTAGKPKTTSPFGLAEFPG
jgi:MFS transporter, BCD family, chlorophyll transporter